MIESNHQTNIHGILSPKELYKVLSSPAPLFGMRYPNNHFPWTALASEGVFWIVALHPGDYDPSPLGVLNNEKLEDLVHGGPPRDPVHETALIRQIVLSIVRVLQAGQGVVIHCWGGRGRTGTVIGCVLRELGHEPDPVLAYLDRLHKARGKPGWPESSWQGNLIKAWDTGK